MEILNANLSVNDRRPQQNSVTITVSYELRFSNTELSTLRRVTEYIALRGRDGNQRVDLFVPWIEDTIYTLESTMQRSHSRSHPPSALDEDPFWQTWFVRGMTPADEIEAEVAIHSRGPSAGARPRLTYEFG